MECEDVFALARMIDAKSKDVASRLGDPAKLRSVDETKQFIGEQIAPRLSRYIGEAKRIARHNMEPLYATREALKVQHQAERQAFDTKLETRWNEEQRIRASRLRKGIAGAWDFLTGKYFKVRKQNEMEAKFARERDSHERHALIHAQHKDRQALQKLIKEMIIIGLLIGGTFSGMKLIESAKVTKAASDLKAFDSGGLTFRDTYGCLPGDLRNPSTRLPNCTALPCSTGGNGDRKVGGDWDAAAITTTDEEFTFWQHLLAADFISNVKPVADLAYGEGQPDSPLDSGGYRLIGYTNTWGFETAGKHQLWISEKNSAAFGGFDTMQDSISCQQARALDSKIDDGRVLSGKLIAQGYCAATNAIDSEWAVGGTIGAVWYRLAF